MFRKLQLVITNQNKKRLSPEMEASKEWTGTLNTHMFKKKSQAV